MMLHNLNIHYEHPEWEFPKGRKNKDEMDLECALREFEEETGISKDKLTIFDNIEPVYETINGSNGKQYKIIYYIGVMNDNEIKPTLNEDNIYHKIEISDI